MNEESRPARRLPKLNITGSDPNSRCGGQRAWAREVNSFKDDELLRCVRAQVAVDTAVNTYRKSAAAPFSFDVPA
jgi:hypothetical protein